jgi:hypothetical protein
MIDDLYIQVAPGVIYYLDGRDQPEPSWDALHSTLARLPRFGGRSRLSVLHHALAAHLVAETAGLDRPTRLLALVHDHHEALVGDVPTPIKHALGGAFALVEAPAERYVRRWLDLDGADHEAVKAIDRRLCHEEAIMQRIATETCPWIAREDRSRERACIEMIALRTPRQLRQRAAILLSREGQVARPAPRHYREVPS